MRYLLLALLLISPALRALTLSEALETALEHNPGEAAAQARLEQARARYLQSRASLSPRLALEASGTHIRYSDSEQRRIPGAPDTTDQFAAGVQASWLLFDGGERRGRLRSADAGTQAAEAALALTRQELMQAVARTHHAARNARAARRIAEADEAFNQRQLEETETRRQAGQAALAERLNFEIRLQQARAARVAADSEESALLAALGALLGLETAAPAPTASDRTPHTPPEDFDAAWQLAETHLPELALARAQREAAQARYRAIRGERIPNIALFAGVEARREENPDFGGDDLGQSAGVVLSYDLWDGRARRNRTREADAQIAEADAELRETELNARARLREALTRLQAARQQSEISQTTLDLTRRNRELIENAHRAGTESLLRLNEAQRDFLNAESRALQAELQLRIAETESLRATGTLQP